MFDGLLSAIVAGLFGLFTWWLSVRHERRKQTPAAPSDAKSQRGLLHSRTRIGIAVLLAALLSGSLVYFVVRRDGRSGGSNKEGKIAVAVLPFTNMSADKEQEYFSDGLAEELLNVLAKNPKLQVTSRTSAFSFKGKDVDVKTIAEKLNVTHVVEGSVRKAGNQLRITAQLIETASDSHLWSETYDRSMQNIFAIQRDIASSISQALKVTLQGGTGTRPQDTSPEAYNLYLLGRHLAARRSPEDVAKGIGYLEQAVQLDPNYAPAWAAVAGARRFQASVGYLPKDEGFAQARGEAQQALKLDPNLAEAYATLGAIHRDYDWNWVAADHAVQRALELKPGDADIMLSSAYMAFTLGRTNQAIQLARQAIERNPLSESAHGMLGYFLYSDNQLAEAEASFRKAIDLYGPESYYEHMLGEILLERGKHEEALAAIRKSPLPDFQLLGNALVYHKMGNGKESDAAVAQLIEKSASEAAYQIAEVYAYRGEKDKAFEWLERARQQRDTGLAELKGDPLLRRLHSDPRWPAFLRKMNLPV